MNIGTNNSYSNVYDKYSNIFSASGSNTAYGIAKRVTQPTAASSADKPSSNKKTTANSLLDNKVIKYVSDLKEGSTELKSALNTLGRSGTYVTNHSAATGKALSFGPEATLPSVTDATKSYKDSKAEDIIKDDESAATLPADSDSAAVTQLQKLADSYNKLYGASVKNSDDPRSEKLFNKITNNSKTYVGSLAKAGIGFDDNGYMTIDKDKAKTAEKNGSLQNLFSGSSRNYGFSGRLSNIASDVKLNTQRYVTQANVGKSLMDAVSYNSGGTVGGVNSGGAGWLINLMF